MDLFTALRARQSIGKVRPDPVPRELVAQILDAAAQAPNHHGVRPWRFVVFTGTGRERLGEAMAQGLLERQAGAVPEALNAERKKALRSPVVIAVGVDKPAAEKVVEIENICAAAAATQNLLLAAHGLGLAAQWRTGDPARDPHVKSFLGFKPDQHVIGLIYVGWPMADPAPPHRPGADDRTVWIE